MATSCVKLRSRWEPPRADYNGLRKSRKRIFPGCSHTHTGSKLFDPRKLATAFFTYPEQ